MRPDQNMDDLLETADGLRALFDATLEVQAAVAENYGLGYEAGEAFAGAVTRAAIHVAGADGPVNDDELSLVVRITGRPLSAHHAAIMRRQMIDDPTGHVENAMRILEGAIYINSLAQARIGGERYDASTDAVVQLVTEFGNVVIAADSDVHPAETRRLSEITGRLRQHAVAMERQRETEAEEPEHAPEEVRPAPKARKAVAALVDRERDAPREEALVRLRRLIGLTGVKLEVETLANLGKVFALRRQKGMQVPEMSFHLVFSGNPGTGKTTVARIIAEAYGELGLLSKGHVVEVDRSGLVANYVGQTATKTRDVIQRSLGGVLFIDEAYALAGRGENDFGAEAIEVLLKAMEDDRDDLVVIAAGYGAEMAAFLQSNPGLRSRFAKTIAFPDYSPDEMVEIFLKLAADAGYEVADEGMEPLQEGMVARWSARGPDFANARDVRILFEAAISAQANRLSHQMIMSDEDLTLLTAADISGIFR